MPAITSPATPSRHPVFDEAAVERLDMLLDELVMQYAGLPLEAVDGLFSSAIVAPGEPVTLQEVLPLVMGEATAPPSEELLQLLQLLWQDIIRRITRGSESLRVEDQPLIFSYAPPEDDAQDADVGGPPEGSFWAMGFILGASLREPDWDPRLEKDPYLLEGLAEIRLLMQPLMESLDGDEDDVEDFLPGEQPLDREAPENDWEEAEDFPVDPDADAEEWSDDEDDWVDWEKDALDEAERWEVIQGLPALLTAMHRRAIEERSQQVPVRREDASGRNDPCPCGSGLKYKKCHGAPSQLN